MRKFERVSGYDYVNLPERKTKGSAGYDIEAADSITLQGGECVLVPTGLKAQMPENEVLLIHIRSSIAIKRGISLTNATSVIDSDYYNNPDNEGHIMLALSNMTARPITIEKGERITQGIFMAYSTTENDEVVAKRTGGIGSTDKSTETQKNSQKEG